MFPISRDPPEGGTFIFENFTPLEVSYEFPISRDPPEGGTIPYKNRWLVLEESVSNF